MTLTLHTTIAITSYGMRSCEMWHALVTLTTIIFIELWQFHVCVACGNKWLSMRLLWYWKGLITYNYAHKSRITSLLQRCNHKFCNLYIIENVCIYIIMKWIFKFYYVIFIIQVRSEGDPIWSDSIGNRIPMEILEIKPLVPQSAMESNRNRTNWFQFDPIRFF